MNHNNQGANAVYNDIHFFNLYDLPIALDGESYHEYLQRVAPVDGLRAEMVRSMVRDTPYTMNSLLTEEFEEHTLVIDIDSMDGGDVEDIVDALGGGNGDQGAVLDAINSSGRMHSGQGADNRTELCEMVRMIDSRWFRNSFVSLEEIYIDSKDQADHRGKLYLMQHGKQFKQFSIERNLYLHRNLPSVSDLNPMNEPTTPSVNLGSGLI